MTRLKLEETSALVFEKLDLEIKNLHIEKESQDYFAANFDLNNLKIIFREAKITPTKIGQFVTLWKRIDGVIEPFSTSDSFDLVVINTKTATHFGQFVFPKSLLEQKGYIKSLSKKGKLGFRIYPSWDKTLNKQAQQTQKWQLNHFLEIPVNLSEAKSLYSQNLETK
ncbi:MepB family protein [Flavobacterium sp.]|uniref:MepB family protein n=1 Tax=Flavobacterium sp. TaxID=239 RepID=UPI00375059AC